MSQADLFSVYEGEEVRIQEAINILKDAGFVIVKVKVEKNEVKNINQLVDYFYSRLYRKFPGSEYKIVRNRGREFKLCIKFFESVRETSSTDELALSECVELIDVIFDEYDDFGFKSAVMDIGVLGQAKAKWITERAVFLLNRKRQEDAERKRDRKADEIENSYVFDYKQRSEELDKILKNLGGL